MSEIDYRKLLRQALVEIRTLKDHARSTSEPIAVVGMGCRFPAGANTPDALWRVFHDGVDAVTAVPADRWDASAFFHPEPRTPGASYSRHGAFLDDVGDFDAQFFHISPREAAALDPQQRLLLEVCWEALENSGIAVDRLRGSPTGVFVGLSSDDYAQLALSLDRREQIDAHLSLGTSRSLAAGRIAYAFKLRGPALQVDTSCSSSLVAVHLACQSLRTGECDLALAGGVNLVLSPLSSVMRSSIGALSQGGRCRAFDAAADGFVQGEGCGVFVLKRLANARRDGDTVLALLLGSAVNHNGASQGVTAPSEVAQQEVIQRALDSAGVAPDELQMVEAHGTGTALGDPIELTALAATFADGGGDRRWYVGSAKTNFGHLEAAAGALSLQKVVLALGRGVIPPSLHYRDPNPHIDWARLPFDIPTRALPWPGDAAARKAGVSSFGISGTNVHIVVGAPPFEASHAPPPPPPYLLPLSAATPLALRTQIERLRDWLRASNAELADVCHTLQHGRSQLPYRLALVVSSTEDAERQLTERMKDPRWQPAEPPPVAPNLVAAVGPPDRLAEAFERGATIDWSLSPTVGRRRLVLPSYPFQRQTLWSDAAATTLQSCQPQLETAMSLSQDPRDTLRTIVAGLLHLQPSEVVNTRPLLEMGADSLVLVELIHAVQLRYQVKLTIRQLFEEFMTVEALAAFLARTAPGATYEPLSSTETAAPSLRISPATLSGATSASSASPGMASAPNWRFARPAILPPFFAASVAATKPLPPRPSLAADETTVARPELRSLTPAQRRHIDDLVERYTRRTAASRRWSERFREPLCNNRRSASSFRLETKELSYAIVAGRSDGSHLWDIDGNEYVDIAMGFGVHLFGHQPPFLAQALAEQLRLGCQIGPESEFAGDVAERLCRMTGHDRALFCNSGTEAVMTALRIARAATGRNRIALFQHSYHGHFDGTLVVARPDGRVLPMVPGVTEGIANDALVLPFDDPRSLEQIERHAGELAAVLVEPVQNRRPGVHAREFLQRLREITREREILLVFDEVLVGFRIHPGGAQAWFGVHADLATYAKVLGGGMPIGVVAGRRDVMDRVDGGTWTFGDDSYPRVPTTYTAGTFCKHPLSMAAARAVLVHLESEGPALQDRLNRRTEQLAAAVNQVFTDEGAPLELAHFGSFFRFTARGNSSFIYQPLELDLFYYHLIDRGIYVCEASSCFLSTAHSDADVARVVEAVRGSVHDLKAGGFWPDTPARETRRLEANIGPALGLYFFGDCPPDRREQHYDLLLKSAVFADEHGFSALWLPERHFDSFGGFSPNPSVLAAAVAAVTRTLRIHAGSVVLPLHHPIRVAEEWSTVDNLSRGRAGVSFATGWHPDDFVLAPQAYGRQREQMLNDIQIVRKLWRGESVSFPNGSGKPTGIRLFPQPVQPELPCWLTTLGNPDTFVQAGALGMGVLTNLIGQSVDELEERIALYREARRRNGFDPAAGQVVVLLHTFVTADSREAREVARQPFLRYLASSVKLFQKMVESDGLKTDFSALSPADRDYLLEKAYTRYVESRALIGNAETCAPILERLRKAGVDQVGCFMDFGIDPDVAYANLGHLAALKERVAREGLCTPAPAPSRPPSVRSIPAPQAQRQLWRLAQIESAGSLAYHLRTLLELRGPLDVGALGQAIADLTARHDALRMSFGPDESTLEVADRVEVAIDTLDVGELELDAWLDDEADRNFDIARIPLWRAQLLRLNPERHVFVFTIHHAVCDGMSQARLLEELAALYTARRRGTPPSLPAVTSWANELAAAADCADGAAKEERTFWRQRLDGVGPLALPFDWPRPRLRSYRGGTVRRRLDQALAAKLREMAALHRCTPYVTLLGCYALLLHRITGQSDLIIGIPVARQDVDRWRGSIGYTSTLLPLCSRIDGIATVGAFLTAVRDRVLETIERCSCSFAEILEEVAERRDGSHPPLVSATFNWDHGAVPVFADLEVEPMFRPLRYARFDLSLDVLDPGGAITLDWDYNADVIGEDTVRGLAGALEVLIADVVTDSQRPPAELPLVSDDDLRRLLEPGEVATDPPALFVARFESWTRLTPDAFALSDRRRQWTYRELGLAASHVAHQLAALGAAPDVRVGLIAEQSADAIVGMLGILMAGAAYVPLDPRLPGPRLARLSACAGLRIVVTTATARAMVPEQIEHTVMVPSEPAPEGPPLPPAAGPGNLAYVMFTSGSTGEPKGVEIEQLALASYIAAIEHRLSLPVGARYLSVSPPWVDLGHTVVFPSLAGGGCLEIADQEELLDARALAARSEHEPIDCLKITPSHLEALLGAQQPERLLPRACLILGGEPVHWELVDRLRALAPGCRILNHYGPTESTVGALVYAIQEEERRSTTRIPIGRPLDHVRAAIFDNFGQLAPPGVPGELHLAGAGLARGYLGQPHLTSERFASDASGVRWYRTGDRCRYLTDGVVDFLGRFDRQVKLRGFRVELEEVEAVLGRQPGVAACAVVCHGDGAEAWLEGFTVPASANNGAPTPAELRRALEKELPSYMVPARITALTRLPLTASGKIDRSNLPVTPSQIHQDGADDPPWSPTEREVAVIWERVLHRSGIGRGQSFFDLGGNSLHAIQVTSIFQRDLGVPFPVRAVFEAPTVEEQAQRIDILRWSQQPLAKPVGEQTEVVI